ncbi:MAG: transglutaminase-like domain-containing protein, partial [Verrucomicrobiales bacterium]
LLAYTRLAIACALVHDSKPGAATNRFFWYVKQDKADRLYRDPKKMLIQDLCLVVGGIDLKELDWVQDNYRKKAPRNGTGKVYANIKYRMDFVTGETKRNDVYKDYTLAEIEENGGICADQTHFATHVCRGLGIPAVGLSGSGDRGAHAWVGYQNDDGTWTTHGRYENYANGSFKDPQTKQRTIESELALRSEPEFRSPARLSSLRDHFRVIDQLSDAGELARATELSKSLLVSNRSYLPGWEKLFQIYGKRRPELAGDGPLTQEEVVSTIRDFEMALKAFPDLLGRADETLLTTLDGFLETETQLKIIKRRRNRVESIDEGRLLAILDLIRQEAKIYSKASDYDAITALYRRELRTGAEDVQHFMKLAGDYWKYSKGNPDREKGALQLISSRVKSNFGDNLKSSDWFTRDTALKPHTQLVKFYREAGESGRAESLERELDRVRKDLRASKS